MLYKFCQKTNIKMAKKFCKKNEKFRISHITVRFFIFIKVVFTIHI